VEVPIGDYDVVYGSVVLKPMRGDRSMRKFLKIMGLSVSALLATVTGARADCPDSQIQQQTISGTSYQLQATDVCKWLVFSNSGAVTVTLPTPSVGFPAPFVVSIIESGGGTVTLSSGSSATINGGSTLSLGAGGGGEVRILSSQWFAKVGGGGGGGGSGTVNSGTGPAIGQYPTGTGTVIGPSTISGDATLAQGGALTIAANAITSGKLSAGAVTYAKMQSGVATGLLGTNAGSAPTEVSVGAGLSLSGGILSSTGGTGTVNSGTGPAMAQYPSGAGTTVGPVTISGDATIAQGGALTIANLAITNAKIAAAAVSYAKIQNGVANGLLSTNAGGAPTEVTVGPGVSISGGALLIAGGAVTNAMLANSVVTINTHSLSLGGTLTLAFTDFAGSITAAQMLGLTQFQIYQGNASNQPASVTLSAAIDAGIGSTRGSILERGASTWGLLTPGTSGLAFVSNGSGVDPAYQALGTTGISNAAITYAKIQNGASTGLLGVNNAAAPTEVAVGSSLQLVTGTLDLNPVIGKGVAVTPASGGTCTGGGSITPNFSTSNSVQITLPNSAACTINNPSAFAGIGEVFNFELTQGGTGSGTVTWGAGYQFGTVGAPTLSTGANLVDTITCRVRNTSGPKIDCTIAVKGAA
jgi:hypothetical protein